jgi:hypothetical protein
VLSDHLNGPYDARVTRRRVGLAVGAVLVVAFVALWAVPMVRGPYVDCGPLDQADCDRAVAGIVANYRQLWKEDVDCDCPYDVQLPPWQPAVTVTILPGSSVDCLNYSIYWPPTGGVVSQSLC